MNPEHNDRTVPRSSKYQWALIETPVNFMDSNFSFNLPLTYEQQEPISELHENLQSALFERMMELLNQNATARQLQVINLYKNNSDITQTEIANILGTNQSSTVKTLRGNPLYKNGQKSQQ